jgi:hypothetical protein
MRRTHAKRMLTAASVAAVTVGALSACYVQMPPPVPQASTADPIAPGPAGAGDVRDGSIAAGATTDVELRVDERSAVLLSAASTDGDDLTMRLVGDGVELENDDASEAPRGLALDSSTYDPLLAAVLEPGTYAIQLAEVGGDSTSFQLQVLTSTTVVGAGETVGLEVAPGLPAIAIASLATGSESIAAVADFDSTLWAHAPGSEVPYSDDDSGGDQNPMLSIGGGAPQDIVVVASSYSGEESGVVELTVP